MEATIARMTASRDLPDASTDWKTGHACANSTIDSAMNASRQSSWFTFAIVVGAIYCLIGVVFALPGSHVRVWRLLAWWTSAIVYAGHIGHEHFRLRNSSRSSALHVALAAAIGGFLLAVSATVHSLIVPPPYHRSLFTLALVVWPIITGVPAFLVAFVATATLNWWQK